MKEFGSFLSSKGFALIFLALSVPNAVADDIDRTHLPILDPTPPTYTEMDARMVEPPTPLKAHG